MSELETFASNPGHVRISHFRWLKHRPRTPLIWTMLTLVSVALSVWVHWAFAAVALWTVWQHISYWRLVQDHFYRGCVNPGVVLTEWPHKIAVLTDLSKGAGEYPAIQILTWRFRTIAGRPITPGMKVATVALYFNSDDECPAWAGFRPLPVECVSGKPGEHKRIIESIDPDDWKDLATRLKSVERPYSDGLTKFFEEDGEAVAPPNIETQPAHMTASQDYSSGGDIPLV